MIRRRSTPWIHKWSRPLIGAIAGLGILNTGYLTFEKLTGGNPVCTTPENVKGCVDVLSSPWGSVFGQPLALFGLLAYISMLFLALSPLAWQNNKALKSIENLTWWLLLVGAIAMSVFSAYLMYILAFELKAVCWYCIASALFAVSMLSLTILGRDWEDIGQILFMAIIVSMVTLIATLGVYSGINTSGNLATSTDGKPVQIFFDPQKEQPLPQVGWKITTTSGDSEIQLAKHLTKIGAKEYIAWWCPHCHEQKLLFGQEAYKEINHFECSSPQNPNIQTKECISAKIKSYPTWIINGKTYNGVQNLDKLANISGYTGSRNFKYFK